MGIIFVVKGCQIPSQTHTGIGWNMLHETQGPGLGCVLGFESLRRTLPRFPRVLLWGEGRRLRASMKPQSRFKYGSLEVRVTI